MLEWYKIINPIQVTTIIALINSKHHVHNDGCCEETNSLNATIQVILLNSLLNIYFKNKDTMETKLKCWYTTKILRSLVFVMSLFFFIQNNRADTYICSE